MKQFYDLTVPISEKTLVFEGDPPVKMQVVRSLEKGDSYNLSCLSLGNHTGTHIDYPRHVNKDGKAGDDYPLDYLIGSGLILEIPLQEKNISVEFIKKQSILKNDIVFFKTKNSEDELYKKKEIITEFVYLTPAAAQVLVELGVKIVGIDYLSIDKYDDEKLSAHHALLDKEVLIVEGLALNGVPAGRCKIYIVPMKFIGLDGLPARVFVEMEIEDKKDRAIYEDTGANI